MSFTIAQIIAVFFVGFFLGSIFGLGIHYLRMTPKAKQSPSLSPSSSADFSDRTPLPDTPETLVTQRAQSSEKTQVAITSDQTISAHSETTIPRADHSGQPEDTDKTKDFQIRLDAQSVSDDVTDDSAPDILTSLDIEQKNSIEEDVTQVMPHKELE